MHKSRIALIASLCIPHISASEGEPTFAEDIAPLVYENCADCHNPNGVGPFSLLSYDDLKKRSRQILEVLEDGFMPPWMPEHGYGPALLNERILSDEKIALFRKWRENDHPMGDFKKAPNRPITEEGWTYGTPDFVVEMEEPYLLKAEGQDEFRNFVMSIPLQDKRHIRAIEFLPGTRLAIHHAAIVFDPTDISRMRDEADPLPGFESMDFGTALRPFGHLIGWAPGQVPYEVYPGTEFPIFPGTDLVVQLHMLPSGKQESISPKIGFHFADEAPSKQSMVIQLREPDIDIPAGDPNYEIEERFALPVSVRALSIFPHTHFLGKDIRIYAELPDGSTQHLLRIPDWDFNWQSDYRYQKPLPLPKGSEIVMRYTFDNSEDNFRNPSNPPIRVSLGNNSYDEMAEVAIQVLLDEKNDWIALKEAQARYDVEGSNGRSLFRYDLASVLETQNRIEEAATEYEAILQNEPQDTKAMISLSLIRYKQQRLEDALFLLQRAVQTGGNAIGPRLHLAGFYVQTNQADLAKEIFIESLRLDPAHLEARLSLATLERQRGNLRGEFNTLLVGLKHHETIPSYRFRIGKLYLESSDALSAQRHFESAASHWETSNPTQAAEAFYQLAVSYYGSQRINEIIPTLSKAIELDSQHGSARLMLATLSLSSNDKKTASEQLIRLITLKGEKAPTKEALRTMLPFPQGTLLLAETYANAGYPNDALETIAWAKQHAKDKGLSDLAHKLEAVETQFGSATTP